MREIKFRGKRIDNGEWIRGYLYYDTENTKTQGLRAFIVSTYDHLYGKFDDYEVDSKTIGQNTGVKNKNGVEVYEGDIISRSVLTDWKSGWKITWDDVLLAWIVENNVEDELLCRFCYDGNFCYESVGEFEVIGNIYDNPEMGKND
jgi:uncharacterized phage protein (TIGR01671 family)